VPVAGNGVEQPAASTEAAERAHSSFFTTRCYRMQRPFGVPAISGRPTANGGQAALSLPLGGYKERAKES
jgi:hypothetical protein